MFKRKELDFDGNQDSFRLEIEKYHCQDRSLTTKLEKSQQPQHVLHLVSKERSKMEILFENKASLETLYLAIL